MKTIGVFFGSRSPEHDVSIITGQLIISGLRKLGYPVVAVYIDKKGRWYCDEQLSHLSFFTNSGIEDRLAKLPQYTQELSAIGTIQPVQKKFFGKSLKIDIAFPAFHGSYGEDGTFQGMMELLNVPYVGCDVASSAITMDKVLTKLMYKAQDIPTTPFVSFTMSEWGRNKKPIVQQIEKKLGYPVMVKPARLGSSIGIAKAKDNDSLLNAIEVALHYDSKVLVEDCIEDLMDVTCAVIGNEEPTPSLLQESVFGDDFFSYEDKYLNDGGAQLGRAKQSIVIPARLDEKTTKGIQDMAVETYKLLGCSGISRVDFLYDKKMKKYYANEVNTLPGTIYHHLWKKSGVELADLLTRLIKYAEEKYTDKKKITYTFKSDLLFLAGSTKLKLKGS